jgi:hemerythrin-like domain-containing protein
VRRHPALQELSRDHQHALAVALKLRRAEPGAAAALREFLAGEGYEHFALEERVLLPAFVPYGDVDDPRIVRMLLDHVRLRAAGQSDDIDLAATGALLERHVRLEEREIFPWIEAAMPEEALVRLGQALAR